jgi:hypothetical protein
MIMMIVLVAVFVSAVFRSITHAEEAADPAHSGGSYWQSRPASTNTVLISTLKVTPRNFSHTVS